MSSFTITFKNIPSRLSHLTFQMGTIKNLFDPRKKKSLELSFFVRKILWYDEPYCYFCSNLSMYIQKWILISNFDVRFLRHIQNNVFSMKKSRDKLKDILKREKVISCFKLNFHIVFIFLILFFILKVFFIFFVGWWWSWRGIK